MVAPGRMAELAHDAQRFTDLPDGVAITFRLVGDGGGVWTLRRAGGRSELRFGEVARPDCLLACSVEDFAAWLQGELDPIEAHVARRVQLEGDVGLLLRMQRRERT